ncbi:MAG: epoxyqueuosine reductase [Candidatus Thorarchaeota archaeon]|nr:MAG: epoxyqueuosine reductase [Candidatus Thorarchaeota archaeon]
MTEVNERVLLDEEFRYATVSIEHLEELQRDFDDLYEEGHLSDNKTFLSYIEGKRYAVPDSFPEAKSVVVLAVRTPLALVNFRADGKQYETIVPPQYYSSGRTVEQIMNTIHQKIIGEPGSRLEYANQHLLLKRLAVRSGLGRYGRNNICYVDGMGTLLTLHAFFSDHEFSTDNWVEARMMDECHNCTICMDSCPQGCISEDKFVIDVGRCVTLYNEIGGEFPEFIHPDSHNALMGCMKCQAPCPANQDVLKRTIRLEDVISEETQAILEGNHTEELLGTLGRKLRGFGGLPSPEAFAVLRRNLSVLIS